MICVIILRVTRLAGHAEYVAVRRSADTVLVAKPEGKKPLKPPAKKKDNIKVKLK
jgi:hypothetical protein